MPRQVPLHRGVSGVLHLGLPACPLYDAYIDRTSCLVLILQPGEHFMVAGSRKASTVPRDNSEASRLSAFQPLVGVLGSRRLSTWSKLLKTQESTAVPGSLLLVTFCSVDGSAQCALPDSSLLRGRTLWAGEETDFTRLRPIIPNSSCR